jgi:hypothetical protein
MARVRTRFPIVFVGHPFGGRFPVTKFRRILQELPFKVVYGNTNLQTRHLLTIMKGNIATSDFSIFDLSESKEVPADIRGIQRIEYTSYDLKRHSGLGDQLVEFILAKEYWIKRIWKDLPATGQGPKKRHLALRILSHLRDHEKLTPENLSSLVRGTCLRQRDRDEVIGVLRKHKFLRKLKTSATFQRNRQPFKP